LGLLVPLQNSFHREIVALWECLAHFQIKAECTPDLKHRAERNFGSVGN
jgi:hypothetical protein